MAPRARRCRSLTPPARMLKSYVGAPMHCRKLTTYMYGMVHTTYSGPYKILQRGGKALQLQVGTRADWVSIDRVKPHVGADSVVPAQPPWRGRPPLQPPRPQAAEDGGMTLCTFVRRTCIWGGGVVLRTRYVEKYSLIVVEKILQLFHAKMCQCIVLQLNIRFSTVNT